jgi:hypothetical protein
MNDAKQSREERLAAKLRENLRRRKDQAREINAATVAETEASTNAGAESPDLPKPPPSR